MSDPLEPFRRQLADSLRSAFLAAGLAAATEPVVAAPPKGRTADFAYPAFAAAKAAGRPPAELAADLRGRISLGPSFREPEAAGPFLNFRIDDRALADAVLQTVLEERGRYGTHPPTGTRVTLEHTSANPTGPFHVGRARNPIIGDSLARILRRAGHTVQVQYWVNDVGKQMVLLAWGVSRLRPGDLPAGPGGGPAAEVRSKPDHELVPYYQEANRRMEADPAVAAEIADWLRKLEAGEPTTTHTVREACDRMLGGLKESLARLGATIDLFVYESETIRDGTAAKVIADLRGSPHAKVDENGACYLDMAALGVGGKERFFFTRGDGTSLYPTRDVAYHLWKLARCDVGIDILGEDHKLESVQLRTALEQLGAPKLPEPVFYSFVRLPEGRMSTRAARVVFLDDLLDEAVDRAVAEVARRRPDLPAPERAEIARLVGVGAVRYNIVRVQAEKDFVFTWEDALNLEGQSAPFLQYAHARCAAVLRKADEEGVASAAWEAGKVTTAEERAVLWQVGQFPSVIARAAADRRPNLVSVTLHDLVEAFNKFYTNVPILKSPEVASRLAVVEAAKWTIGAGLDCLGIAALDRM